MTQASPSSPNTPSSSSLPTWAFLPVLPDELMSALNNLLSKSISDLGHDELRAVIQSAQAAIGLLRERSDDQWLWIAEMNFRPWSEQEKRTL